MSTFLRVSLARVFRGAASVRQHTFASARNGLAVGYQKPPIIGRVQGLVFSRLASIVVK